MRKDQSKILIVAERVDLDALDKSFLTTDTHAVRYTDDEGRESVDLVRCSSMSHIFDAYYDAGYGVMRIWVVGGTRNPKVSKAELRVK